MEKVLIALLGGQRHEIQVEPDAPSAVLPLPAPKNAALRRERRWMSCSSREAIRASSRASSSPALPISPNQAENWRLTKTISPEPSRQATGSTQKFN